MASGPDWGLPAQAIACYEEMSTLGYGDVISCSYGPGRYDHTYEEEGHDYPYGHVRWTENRNMAA